MRVRSTRPPNSMISSHVDSQAWSTALPFKFYLVRDPMVRRDPSVRQMPKPIIRVW